MAARFTHLIAGLDGRSTLCFAAVGAAATGIYLGLALAGSWLGLPAALSSLVAYAIAAMWSYAGHRWLTFRSDAPVAETAPRFLTLSVVQYLIALAVPALLADYGGVRADIAYLGVCLLVPLSSLVLMPRLVFTARSTQPTWQWRNLFKAAAWHCSVVASLVIVSLLAAPVILADPDTQWHIASGRLVLEGRALLQMDHFSHTFAGHPWISKEWLSQVLLAAGYLAGSWTGVALLTTLAIALTFHLIVGHVARNAGVDGGIAMGALFATLAAPTFLARPHILVFPVLACWTIALVRSAEADRRPPWLALPLIMLWANLHGAFITGLVIAGAFGFQAVFNARPQERTGVAAQWAAFGLAGLLAVTLTPYGYGPLLLSIEVAKYNEGLQYIGEWRGVEPTMRWAFLLAVAGTALVALGREPRRYSGSILLIAFLTYMMCKHQRFVMFFAIVVPILAGAPMAALARETFARFGLFQRTESMPSWIRSRQMAAALATIAVVLLVTLRPVPPPSAAPIAALASVPSAFRAEPVFNSHDFGGFLTLAGVKTFIDGRTDQLFLGGFMIRMMKATQAREPGPLAELLDEHRIGWAILGARKPEVLVFPQLTGWRLHYEDAAAQVWLRQR